MHYLVVRQDVFVCGLLLVVIEGGGGVGLRVPPHPLLLRRGNAVHSIEMGKERRELHFYCERGSSVAGTGYVIPYVMQPMTRYSDGQCLTSSGKIVGRSHLG